MKRILLFLFLQVFILHNIQAQDICSEHQCVSATINGQAFQFRDYWPISANLIKQQASMDGRRPQRSIISINLSGGSYLDVNAKQFNEAIQLEIEYTEGMQSTPPVYTISLQYQSGLYSVIRDTGSLVITEIKPEPGKQGFRMSCRLNCTMRSWAAPYERKEDLMLNATLSDIYVGIPGWLVSKN